MARTFRRTPGDTRGRTPKAHRTPQWGRYAPTRGRPPPDDPGRDWDAHARDLGHLPPNTYEPDPQGGAE